VHQINDTRMFGGTPHLNLRRLGQLRGERSARNIVLVTTMWDVRKTDGEKREDDLKEGYWKIMIQHGATLRRFENSSASAWAIFDEIIARHNDGAYRSNCVLQEKMWNLKKIAASVFNKKRKAKALYGHLQNLLGGRNDVEVNVQIDFLMQVESKIEEILQESLDDMRILLNTKYSIFLDNYFAKPGMNVNVFASSTLMDRTESNR